MFQHVETFVPVSSSAFGSLLRPSRLGNSWLDRLEYSRMRIEHDLNYMLARFFPLACPGWSVTRSHTTGGPVPVSKSQYQPDPLQAFSPSEDCDSKGSAT